jgi:hypothetical protein
MQFRDILTHLNGRKLLKIEMRQDDKEMSIILGDGEVISVTLPEDRWADQYLQIDYPTGY